MSVRFEKETIRQTTQQVGQQANQQFGQQASQQFGQQAQQQFGQQAQQQAQQAGQQAGQKGADASGHLPGTSGKHPFAESIGTAITGGAQNAGTKGYLAVCGPVMHS